MRYYLLLVFNFLFTSLIFCQENQVKLNKNGKLISLNLTKQATHENINGKVNLAILTDNNDIIELNNIDESVFKCGKRLYTKTAKIVLMEKEKTYVSFAPINIYIVCIKNTNKVKVYFSGKVRHNKTIISINSYLTIIETTKKNITIK
jgi:hypothetical protein